MAITPSGLFGGFLSVSALASGAAAALWVAGPALGSGPVATLDVGTAAVPLSRADPARDRVGRLRYAGGLVLTAADRRFGGLSGALWDGACGRLLAVSDSGAWVILEPEEDGDRLVGVRAAWIAPVRDRDGRAPLSKKAADAEGLARTADGRTWVSYEQDHRAEGFPGLSACRPESLAAVPDREWRPAASVGWVGNGGMEAFTGLGDRLATIPEQVPPGGGPHMGQLGPPGAPQQAFAWAPPRGFQPTAMDTLDAARGRVLVLSRRFSPLEGVAAVVSEGELADGLAPVEVARLQPPLAVDNMEALAIREEGERRYIYLISDDNFNALQRTLVLKFELLPAAGPEAR